MIREPIWRVTEPAIPGEDSITLRRAPAVETVHRLLAEAGLPSADVTPEQVQSFYIAESTGEAVGLIGLEPHGRFAFPRA